MKESAANTIDKVYESAFTAYSHVKSLVVLEGIEAIICGIVITFMAFKMMGILKDILSEGRGFNGKHFFEMTKQYMFCIALIVCIPIIMQGIEKVFSYAAENLVENIVINGEYQANQMVKDIAKELVKDCEDLSFSGLFLEDPMLSLKVYLIATVGTITAWLFEYVTFIFIVSRYMILLLLEIVAPIAIVCLLYDDTRNSFYTWIKSLLACYMLYPGLVMASLFADQLVVFLINKNETPTWLLIIFGLSLKTSLLATVKTTISKWL